LGGGGAKFLNPLDTKWYQFKEDIIARMLTLILWKQLKNRHKRKWGVNQTGTMQKIKHKRKQYNGWMRYQKDMTYGDITNVQYKPSWNCHYEPP
jgi:hypothetical protein